MLLPIKFTIPDNVLPTGSPAFYSVGEAEYKLIGKNEYGDLIYELKKIPKRKVFTFFPTPPVDDCLDTDQDPILESNQGDRLCPDQCVIC